MWAKVVHDVGKTIVMNRYELDYDLLNKTSRSCSKMCDYRASGLESKPRQSLSYAVLMVVMDSVGGRTE